MHDAMTSAINPKPEERPAVGDRMVGLSAFTQRRKAESREQLLSAATELFREKGYYAVSIDDIAALAGVSRMTFYRHFRSRAAILMELFEHGVATAMPQLLAIRDRDFRDPAVVYAWVAGIFDADWPHRRLRLAFSQAARMDREFVEGTQRLIRQVIEGLGERIPAFAVSDQGEDRRRWLQAWLVVYEILDQSNQSMLDMGVGRDPLILDLVTERFTAFAAR